MWLKEFEGSIMKESIKIRNASADFAECYKDAVDPTLVLYTLANVLSF